MGDIEQTKKSFGDKWVNNQELAFSETLRAGSDIFNWIVRRNGFPNEGSFGAWINGKTRILDAGCGNGRVTALLRKYAREDSEIVGVDLTSVEVARTNLNGISNVSFKYHDLMEPLDVSPKFDLIYCQEVLHHTRDPEKGFANLVACLAEGGEIAIYVYKKKAPTREFIDEFIRSKISGMDYNEAWEAMSEVTELGRTLSELSTNVSVPNVKLLEIEEGQLDIQRFIYHYFFKCFWNKDLSFSDNVAINYDWYHPSIASKHTLAEVESWFLKRGLTISNKYVDHYGICVRGTL